MGEKKDLKNMTVEEIKEYLKPTHSEVFEGYLCVGFRSDNDQLVLIGDVGHKWNNYRDCLKRSAKVIQEMFEDEGAESYWN